MTDPDLRELLHDHVRDVTGPDLADRAWERARGIRRRRAGTAVVAATVVAVVAGSALWSPSEERTSDPVAPSPSPSRTSVAPDPYVGGGRAPDARAGRWPVYWGPSAQQEASLPAVNSPLPATIDLAAPAVPIEDAPVESALASYVVTDPDGSQRVLVLAPDGSLRSVDVSRVRPLIADGVDVSVARETLLSPTGRFLAFPRNGGVEVLTLATATWRSIDTGSAPTAYVGWLGDSDLHLPPDRLGGQGPTYDALDGSRIGSNGVRVPEGPVEDGPPVGRYRQGPLGTAQVWSTSGVPVPLGGRTPSRVLVVDGEANAADSLLTLGEFGNTGRSESCCSVAFWLDNERIVYESDGVPRRLVAWRVGTHELGLVATIDGVEAGQRVVSSYVRVWS